MATDYPSRLRQYLRLGAIEEKRVAVGGCSDVLMTTIHNTGPVSLTEMLCYLILLDEKEYNGLGALDCSRPQNYALAMTVSEPLALSPVKSDGDTTTLACDIFRSSNAVRNISILLQKACLYDVHIQLTTEYKGKTSVVYDHVHIGDRLLHIRPDKYISLGNRDRRVTFLISVPTQFVDDWRNLNADIERIVGNMSLHYMLSNE